MSALSPDRIAILARLGAKVTPPMPESMVEAIAMNKRRRKKRLKRVFKK
jgi:hypothetical protein